MVGTWSKADGLREQRVEEEEKAKEWGPFTWRSCRKLWLFNTKILDTTECRHCGELMLPQVAQGSKTGASAKKEIRDRKQQPEGAANAGSAPPPAGHTAHEQFIREHYKELKEKDDKHGMALIEKLHPELVEPPKPKVQQTPYQALQSAKQKRDTAAEAASKQLDLVAKLAVQLEDGQRLADKLECARLQAEKVLAEATAAVVALSPQSAQAPKASASAAQPETPAVPSFLDPLSTFEAFKGDAEVDALFNAAKELEAKRLAFIQQRKLEKERKEKFEAEEVARKAKAAKLAEATARQAAAQAAEAAEAAKKEAAAKEAEAEKQAAAAAEANAELKKQAEASAPATTAGTEVPGATGAAQVVPPIVVVDDVVPAASVVLNTGTTIADSLMGDTKRKAPEPAGDAEEEQQEEDEEARVKKARAVAATKAAEQGKLLAGQNSQLPPGG